MVTRGCGDRVAGGVYFECALSSDGKPVEAFLFCPPEPVPAAWGLTPVSTRLINEDVVDWIGESYYPNVLDYIEEVRALGLSGRLPSNFPFHRLTRASRFLPVHRRAIIDNWEYMLTTFSRCKREAMCPHMQHGAQEGYCAGFWWEDVRGGEPASVASWRWSRAAKRVLPSFSYIANAQPEDFVPAYTPGILAAFPLTRLVVVAGEDSDETIARLQDTVQRGVTVAHVEK